MQITQRLVEDVIRSNKKIWHDKEWHTFQSRKEVEAIHYAMQIETDIGRIVSAAKEYISQQSKQRAEGGL